MSPRKQDKATQNFQQTRHSSKANRQEQMQWLLRGLLVIGKQPHLSGAGFVLPTVAMVSLVVVLLTTAVFIRSFDRSKNASYVRVNQAVLNAATPALDRARAKMDALFADPTLPRGTPSDFDLYTALNRKKYRLGDETRLKLVREFNGQSGIQQNSTATAVIENDETLTTAWRFPVDTDNNGKFDSYTLYGIYFRSPTRGTDGNFNRLRNPLEARTPPMEGGTLSGQCAKATDTSASSIGKSDWYKSGAKLTKSFFVYTATVPITNITNIAPAQQSQYEPYKGNKGFYALELQQDRTRIPLNNNAVWYEDDIEISQATTIRLNGRVFTNSNLMVGGNTSSSLRTIFYQVSDPDSCYYEEENSKIVVGGNVANADIGETSDLGLIEVHRFQGKGTPPVGLGDLNEGINSTNKTTTQNGGRWVGYNNRAYNQRIATMEQAALALHGAAEPTVASVQGVARYPQEVKDRFKQRLEDPNETKEPRKILPEELETYFKDHTRRVPYAEVPGSSGSATALGSYTEANVLGSTNPIRPPDEWMKIENTNLALNFSSNTMHLRATEPTQQQNDGKENFIGDRILVGNNLPFFWPKFIGTVFDKFADKQEEQFVKNGSNTIYWNNSSNGNATSFPRTRQSQLQILPDLGSVDRDGFWETEAAKLPNVNENTGGLRVITGAGIYIDGVAPAVGASGGTGERTTNPALPKNSFLPAPSLNAGVTDPGKFQTNTITSGNDNIIVWSDLMPMWDGSSQLGDLQMRATAVYHYKQGLDPSTPKGDVDPNQVPIACVSSYYDPTDQTTARNRIPLPDVSGISDTNGDGIINNNDKLADGSTPGSTSLIPAVGSNNGRSNNGVTYNAPYTNDTGRTSAVSTYRAKLNRQARMIFPTGRIVNDPLRKALINIDANKPRSLADNAAIDTAICALKIQDNTLLVQTSPNVPHGAIKEAVFLDGRQVKSLNNHVNLDTTLDNTKIAETLATLADKYTLPLEQRQPLEIRVTELDLNLLRTKEIGTPTNSNNNDTANDIEYLLPNSGIIYATRDDALPDLSDSSPNLITKLLVSPNDFRLDSTRRPNGIRLINGSNLARKNFYRVLEKGLIMATNLPTYIEGNFNLHKDPGSSTNREEFTDTLDEDDWSNFYTRNNTLNENFARRESQPGYGAGSGDQWRPATIISDAQTLLSSNFLDGFRNQGDYDLNNNQGNSAASFRKKQGFWNNNFVTSANWAGSDGYPASKNSYLTNGVSPIQRRVDNFPEYVMEICRKLPVSECGQNDWVVGFDRNGNGNLNEPAGFDVDGDGVVDPSKDIERIIRANQLGRALANVGKNAGTDNILSNTEVNWPNQFLATGITGTNISKSPLERLGAGTTARPALVAADQRYARRVAFARNQFGTLVFTSIATNDAAKPLGVGCPLDANNTTPAPENSGCRYPNPSETLTAGTHYGLLASDNALWFRTTNNTNGDPGGDIVYTNNRPLYYLPPELNNGEKLILPDTPEIPGVTTLNGSGTTDPSDFTMCIVGSGYSKRSLVSTVSGSCSINLAPQVSQLLGLTPAGVMTAAPTQNLTASTTNDINVYKLPLPNSTIPSGTTITLNGNSKSIFIFQGGSSTTFGSSGGAGITLILNGVSPNNILWVSDGSLQINNATTSQPHRLAGNFIGKSSLQIGANTQILGGRFLNFNNNSGGIPASSKIYAVSDGQPSLVPILHIHSPTGTPTGTVFNGVQETNWLQVATTTTANAAFIAGDTPSRPSERGGGFHNFVRFLENWSPTGSIQQTARISGSFIQYKRSSYASAPFYSVDPTVLESSGSLFYTLNGSNQPAYSSSTGFRYRTNITDQRASFYRPPNRSYGYDVALLSQSPDLFAQKFTVTSTGRPSEYFREVDQNDPWIQTLLCAAEASDVDGGPGATYTKAAIPNRPPTCPNNLPYPSNP